MLCILSQLSCSRRRQGKTSSPRHPSRRRSPSEGCCTQTTVVRTTTTAVVTVDNDTEEPDPITSAIVMMDNDTEEADPIFITTTTGAKQFIWDFPPPYSSPKTPPPQYTLYNDQDALQHGLSSDRQGFEKRFRKYLVGRWRCLVKRKPETDTFAFPPEVKAQLKTIYVY